ncbi:hypothetical protein GGF42_001738 [Coemansia sp. RSA 2424]|nr:hypothetical protein GGF42_001738 [Coemansia sp. RSA 2424]
MSKQSSNETPRPADTQLGAVANYVLKPVLVLPTAAIIFSSFKVSRQYFIDRHALCPLCTSPLATADALLDDCLRLGVIWPALNLLLSMLLAAGQLLALMTKRNRSNARQTPIDDKPCAPTDGSADAEMNMRATLVATSLTAAVAAFAFTHVFLVAPWAEVHGYQLAYWRSNKTFWLVLLQTCSYDLLDFMSYTSAARHSDRPAVHWSVVAATLLQLVLCAPVEALFTVAAVSASGAHASMMTLRSAHSCFVLVSALTASVAAYFSVRAYRQRF